MIQLIKPFGKVYSSKGKFSEVRAHPINSTKKFQYFLGCLPISQKPIKHIHALQIYI